MGGGSRFRGRSRQSGGREGDSAPFGAPPRLFLLQAVVLAMPRAGNWTVDGIVKPRILVLADVNGWAWDRKARAYERHLADDFDVTVGYQTAPRAFEGLPFDLVHCFEVSQLAAIPANHGGKLIAGLTALVWRTWGEERMRAWAARCDAMHGNSPAIVEALRPFHPRVYYTPNGVDATFFRRYRPRRDAEVVACHVAKPTPRKGGAIVVEACRRAGIKCLLVQRTSQIRLPVEQVLDIYQDAWVQVVASAMDGTPNPALESMACGNMLLANAVGNVPELFRDGGVIGFIYENPPLADAGLRTERLADEAVEWYADWLGWCKSHQDDVVDRGKAARRAIESGWTWAHTTEAVRIMWKDVLNA